MGTSSSIKSRDSSGLSEEYQGTKDEKDDKTIKEYDLTPLNTAIETIKKFHSQRDTNRTWKEDLMGSLNSIKVIHDNIGTSSYDVALKYRQEAGTKLSETETTKRIVDVVIDCWLEWKQNADGTNETEKTLFYVLKTAILVLCKFSHSSSEVSCDIVNNEMFIGTLKEILNSHKPSTDTQDNKNTEYNFLIRQALDIVCTVSQVDQTIPRLRSLRIVKAIQPYLDENDDYLRLVTLAALANIIDEKQSEILKNKHDVIQLLLRTFQSALENNNHMYKGWSARECGLCVRRLARNDANKRLLVRMGCLHQLVKLAKCKTVEEQREAVGAILVLAFSTRNRRKILEQTKLGIIDLLVKLKEQSEDKETREAADKTLWIFRKKLKKHEKYKVIANSYIKKAIDDSDEEDKTENVLRKKKNHVMISYSWGHQKEVKRIRKILKRKGFPVWIDIKNMGGTTLQGMAEAVENARVVLVCYSRKYKDSPNCRAEAEYAFEERKEIIPLRMDKDYKRDGWLAMVITGRKFIDFSGKYPFHDKIEELCQRLGSIFRKDNYQTTESQTSTNIEQAESDVADTPPTVPHSAPKETMNSIRNWTSTDVNNWIKKHNLPRKELGQLTGRDLAGLIAMKDKAPESFYKCLRKDLKITRPATIDMFTEAFNDFTN